jgi:hypothetical protein
MNALHNRLVRSVLTLVAICVLAPTVARAGQSLVRVPVKGPIVFEQLRRPGIEILAVDKYGFADVLVDDKQIDYVFSLGYPVSAAPIGDIARAAPQLDADLGLYHTFAEMESLITTWESDFPAICDVFTIGSSIEARTIYAIKISDNVSVDETDEAEVLFIGNHHAREVMSVEIPLLFAEYLLVNYGSDPTVTARVDTREIYFVPMLNPDGHVYVELNHGGASGSWWRKNRRVNSDASIGVDLNRNYAYGFAHDDIGSSGIMSSITYRGEYAFSEPETQVIRDFVNSREFTMWLSYHSYGELLLYPWGFIPENTPDHNVYSRLGELLTASNGYFAGNLANGAIYAVNGDSDDWGYGEQATKKKIFAFTPEVNSSAQGGFGPPDSLIAPTFALLLEMNLLTLELCENPYSVVGPYRPTMYAISDPYYPIHTLFWSGNDPTDPNPVVNYRVERCTNPSQVPDPAESLSPLWVFDGFSLDSNAYSGSWSYYSGSGDALHHSVTSRQPMLVEAQSDTFAFWTYYEIETDWDYAYVEVSDDDGGTWTTVEGNITTADNPNGNNRGHGITGFAPGWVEGIFPLTDYLGQELLLRISYITDAYVDELGIYADDLEPVPTCQAVEIIASSVTDTTLQVIPDQVATYRYRVEGTDAEADGSRWSTSQTIDITTVSEASAPLSFRSRLEQNRPNPFNPVTRIPYVVGGSAQGGSTQEVTLRIYDVAGRVVTTLVNEGKAPGVYETTWTGVSDDGTPVASGVYLYRLTIGGRETYTRKLVLLK